MTTVMAADLNAALDRLDTDPDLRAGVLTGSGGYFCAGQDLGEALRGEFARTVDRGWFGLVDRPPNKPLIAAIEGFALAGGLEIALSCDLIVAASDASFGIPEVRNGQVAAARGLTRLPLRLPYHVAAEMALTGDPVPADLMHRHGLLTRLVAPGEALETALKLARRIAQNPPVAMRVTLDSIRDAVASVESIAWARQSSALSVYAMAGAPEYQEGVSAFLEKRLPNWADPTPSGGV
ncbi:enoyl-CoA hydratase [Microbacterium sp. W4I4]|nr:enoyl-CoA hydratase [Microbacterium sp. W4I4]